MPKKKKVDVGPGISLSAFIQQRRVSLSDDRFIAVLRKGPRTVPELAKEFMQSEKDVESYLKAMADRGVLVGESGGRWVVEDQAHIEDHGLKYTYVSRSDNSYTFGLVADTHFGSKYERLDVLNDLYDRFEDIGVDRVFHGGNWIDGECRLNRHELHTYGLEGQCQYVVDNYPRKKAFQTFAIWGDCHEGWFGKDTKLNVGRHLERMMQDAGRTDWANLGFLESYVPLRNVNSGKTSHLLVMHPGGGTSYAVSYKPQKIVESIMGGEKPAVLAIGHFHKAEYIPIRNVHVFQMGCCQDQCTWSRKNRIEPVVGGWVVRLVQDPKTGAITACCGEWFHYFNKGYYNDKWSPFGPVKKSERVRS